MCHRRGFSWLRDEANSQQQPAAGAASQGSNGNWTRHTTAAMTCADNGNVFFFSLLSMLLTRRSRDSRPSGQSDVRARVAGP
jgi:hypothetical protein